jgi:prophage regulatory protein
MAILRKPQARAELGYRSDTSIQNAIKAGLITRPVLIGSRAVGWPADEIEAINAARIAGKTDDEIRALVEYLQGQRAIKFERLMGGMAANDAAPAPATAGNVVELGRR